MQDSNHNKNSENNKGETNVSPVSFHNIYKHLNISVKTLDFIIVFLVVALLVTFVISIRNRGFTIEFDSLGGTAVESQKHLYGEQIDYVIPDRENFTFDGWALDKDCSNKWDKDRTIIESVKLYACWIED